MSYTAQMREIKAFDPSIQDDGGVEHPPIVCIMLHGCAFRVAKHRCRTLGMCGCALVYDLAHGHGGYRVIDRDNEIAEALVTADMVRAGDGGIVETQNGRMRTGILRANIKCGIPRPNTTVDLHSPSSGVPWEKR